MDDYDVGDTVGTFDAVTGLRIIATITKKIITIKNGQINIDISTDSNSSHSTGGESNTGRSDAVKSVNGMTGEVEITASDIGAVPTSRTVNGKELSSNISLAFSNLADEFSGAGTAGTNGYVAFAQLKITSVYTNRPIEFELICRGRPTSCLVSVQFSNENSTDPSLSAIYYRGSSYGVFIQKTATSTWLLYYQKSEGWDGLTVKRVSSVSQGITITHPGSFVTSKPTSNVTNATPYELEKSYPVGAIYISTSSTSPASLFGGTWEQLKDRFLVGAGNSYSVNGTGGASSVSFTPRGSNTGTALTVKQIPSHGHGFMLNIQHSDGDKTSGESMTTGLTTGGRIRYYGGTYSVGGGQTHTHTFVGTKQTVSTMPPYLAVYMWKRVI